MYVGTQENTQLRYPGWSSGEEATAGLTPEHQVGATCRARKRQVGSSGGWPPGLCLAGGGVKRAGWGQRDQDQVAVATQKR